MIVETCPLLNDIPWIKHGFYGADTPHALSKSLSGIVHFSDEFPNALFLNQTHSDRVLNHDDDLSVSADGILTAAPHVALAIKTADCCPIFLVCTKTQQIAAVHAGWRGALNRITDRALEKMTENGATPQTMIAAIGPAICGTHYPVQEDVRAQFADRQPEALPFFVPFEDRWKLDVSDIIRFQLQQAGVAQIWRSPVNTFTDPRYASYRAYSADTSLPEARNISLIMKKGE